VPWNPVVGRPRAFAVQRNQRRLIATSACPASSPRAFPGAAVAAGRSQSQSYYDTAPLKTLERLVD
jgi:hypothetical protein